MYLSLQFFFLFVLFALPSQIPHTYTQQLQIYSMLRIWLKYSLVPFSFYFNYSTTTVVLVLLILKLFLFVIHMYILFSLSQKRVGFWYIAMEKHKNTFYCVKNIIVQCTTLNGKTLRISSATTTSTIKTCHTSKTTF